MSGILVSARAVRCPACGALVGKDDDFILANVRQHTGRDSAARPAKQ